MVREYEEEAHRRVNLLLDNALPATASELDEDALERAISLCASLASHYLGRGFAVRLVCRGTAVPAAAGPAQLHRVLKTLALLPTVAPDTPFAGAPEAQAENLLVARKGGAPRHVPPGVGRVLEAA
jgi:uncharacterized protein (DUF58 family)